MNWADINIVIYKRNRINNWGRIALNKTCHILRRMSNDNIVKNDIMWFDGINTSLAQIELQYITYGGGGGGGGNTNQSPHNVFFEREIDIFPSNSFAEMNRENSKQRTYKLFKTSIKEEPYLTEIKKVKESQITS